MEPIAWNSISKNNVAANGRFGAFLVVSSDNKFHQNNFINNAVQARSYDALMNVWDAGYPKGGNYWSDYKGVDNYKGPYQNETGSDGIGDTPYVIDAHNVDRYPLMRPWKLLVGDVNEDGVVDVYDLVLIVSAYGAKEGDPRWNPLADVAPPHGVIDIYDVVTAVSNYGKRR